ncbi:MAG: hypothetical protein B6U95_00210 [Thermofilum sp. ex4484_82]|nr:MAG: hypothetical protein B6U95_00210 [Thermofilum sp. ex4484_82]OYT40153.1 MAG: hypothetical protein B6U96_00210 [Archaeoglobales archaeon ex4484_92]
MVFVRLITVKKIRRGDKLKVEVVKKRLKEKFKKEGFEVAENNGVLVVRNRGMGSGTVLIKIFSTVFEWKKVVEIAFQTFRYHAYHVSSNRSLNGIISNILDVVKRYFKVVDMRRKKMKKLGVAADMGIKSAVIVRKGLRIVVKFEENSDKIWHIHADFYDKKDGDLTEILKKLVKLVEEDG